MGYHVQVMLLIIIFLSAVASEGPQAGCNKNDSFIGRQDIVNPGGNALYLSMCPKSGVVNGVCPPSALVPCLDVFGPGNKYPVGSRFPAESVVVTFNPPGEGAYIVISYATTDPFSWHNISSAPSAIYNWTGDIDGPPFIVPYSGGVNGTTYCDSSADCQGGAACIAAPAPPRCGPAPSPSALPPPKPIPSPTPGPPAITCNLTGQWLQYCPTCHGFASAVEDSAAAPPLSAPVAAAASHALLRPPRPLGYRPEASITITSEPGGVFSFSCKNDPQVGYCPLWTSNLNGTGMLSPSDNGFTATALNGTTLYHLTGVLNETFSCATLTWLGASPSPEGGSPQPISFPVEWDRQPPSTPPALDLSVTAATFLGAGGSGGGTQLVVTGIAIISAASPSAVLIAVAGNGVPNYPNNPPTALLMGAAAASNGTLVILKADMTAPRGSGVTVVGVVKLGGRVDHVRSNAAGDVAVAGDFGVAAIGGLASGTPAVTWRDNLTNLEPGDCGICCTNGGSTTCRVDIGDDGLVVANYAVQSDGGSWLWGGYSPSGTRFISGELGVAAVTTLFVDSARFHFGVGYHYVSNTGQESMIMPKVDIYTYTVVGSDGDTVSYAPDFSLFDWDATIYRNSSQPCNGDVADGRVLDVRVGRSAAAPLLVSGRSDGGNSPYHCGMRNSSLVVPFDQIDQYTESANMQAQAIVNMILADGATGESILGEIELARLGPGGGGNTLENVAAQTDSDGNVYQLQNAAYCIPNMGNLTINGIPTAPPSDATALLILTPTLAQRLHWTDFAAANPGQGSSGSAVDMDVRGSVVAVAMNSGQSMVVSGGIPGTGPDATGSSLVGYVVILPTVASS